MNELNFDRFIEKFDFNEDLAGFIGIERERFLLKNKTIVPQSPIFLEKCSSNWTYELSSCQVEDRTSPKKKIKEIRRELISNDRVGNERAKHLNLKLKSLEVGPQDMSLKIYPNPRYLKIAERLPEKILSAACRVTGTHIHIGMPNLETAILVSNLLRRKKYFERFCKIGDHSNGQRLKLYKMVATDWYPPYYKDKKDFFKFAKEKSFAQNPRNCWHLIRISVHGTIELRMFGSTNNIDEIIGWAQLIRHIIPNSYLS